MAASVKNCVSYEQDLYAWTQEQAALLRARLTGAGLGELGGGDLAMGTRSARAEDRLRDPPPSPEWQMQPARRGAGWRKTLRNQRRDIRKLLKQSPSLRHKCLN